MLIVASINCFSGQEQRDTTRSFKNKPRKVALYLYCNYLMEVQDRGNPGSQKLSQGNKAVEGY